MFTTSDSATMTERQFLSFAKHLPEPDRVAGAETARKPGEVVLSRTEAELQSILNTAADGIITIDERGIIQLFNSAVERLFGYTADELQGQNVNMLMPSPDRERHDAYIASYLSTGEKKIIGIGREVTGRRKDGSTFPLYVAVSEVQLGARRLFTGIARDITELKELQERLVQSARLAAIGEVITGLAHESRNALQRSQACLEMLQLELDNQPEALELVRRIQNAQDHLHHLYEEVRQFAAPIQIQREPCDLAHLWRNVWSHLELHRKGKQVQFCEMTGGLDLTCEVDSFAIGQVFCNILENAISVCPAQGQIVIGCRAAEIGGRAAVQVALRDNGPGVAAEARARIFEPFFTTKTKGTGLGMAIARRIVEAHGGTIALGDGLKTGAEILVTLPREGP